ncbi:uridine diphosphate glucose pyrophosphatase-like [Zootermopsis nevadensis]|uniref:Uridine diphosphate glucose pyrophosphatase NUDT14 n=1 Tax=Zootermopsis nevadensis TaxID=136037 RepID=A0A067RHA2_ZOONE|nr:uridine diphosphate glucose pyrophosphatase-like [Zootermopsis nevadensis]KDR18548.1 Uridine diphosphate glucose pyrophosphatase [Zootermopsis nevadensis]
MHIILCTVRKNLPSRGKMDRVQEITLSSLCDSDFVKPFRMNYTQNGIEKIWDLIKIHNSVSIFIYNTTRNVLVFVKQFRPAVYLASIPEHDRGMKIDTSKYPPESGITLELCAGIVDKDLPLEEIARTEVLEECGYDVPVSKFERIIAYRSGIGVSGDKQTIFYTEVTDNMKVGEGGGNLEEGEFIEVVEMTIPEAKKYVDKGTVQSPGAFIFALFWFFQNKCTS